MLEIIQKYSSLINIGLFGVVIGWLIHISTLSRTALVDKFEAKLAAKDQEIEALNHAILRKEENFKTELTVVEHSRSFFEKLASLPEDEAVKALKIEYELRIAELDKKESEATKESDKQEIKEEISELKKLGETVTSMIDSGHAIVEIARFLTRFI